MKFKAFLILLLLSLYGSHSFGASSSLKNAQKKHTINLLKEMGTLLEKIDPSKPLQRPFFALLKSGFSESYRDISDTSGIRFRMNLDYLYHMLQKVQGKTVIVLGASSGEEGLLALLFGASEVVLNDLLPSELARAEKLYAELSLKMYCPHGKISFVPGNCLSVLPKKQFDFILAHNLVHFFDGAQMSQFKILMGQITKPNSLVYLTANPCSHKRYKRLKLLRKLKKNGTLPKGDARLNEIQMTIGSFPKSTLLALDIKKRGQRAIFVDPGYDTKDEKFYLDEDFPHNGQALSRPLDNTTKIFKTKEEINTLLKEMAPYIKAKTDLTPEDFLTENLVSGEGLAGMKDTRLRRVFSPCQLAELLVHDSHSLFALESCAFFATSAVATHADGKKEIPVQVCCEENTFVDGEIPDFLLDPSKHNPIALPCVILKAVSSVMPFSMPMTREEFEALKKTHLPSKITLP